MIAKRNNERTSFDDMLELLKKIVQEKDAEIEKLRKENTLLKEALPEGFDLNELLDETLKRR